MPTAAEIRAELAALHEALARDGLMLRSGRRTHSLARDIAAAHPLPASRGATLALWGLLRGARGEERDCLHRLLCGCVEAHVRAQLAPLSQAAAALLPRAGVSLGGEFVPLIEAAPWLQRQQDAAARARFAAGFERACASANPLLRRLIEEEDRLLSGLGFGGYLGWCRFKSGIDYAAVLPAVEASLERTAGAYFEGLARLLRRELPSPEPTRCDSIYLLRLGRLDRLFPPARLNRLPAQLTRLGLDAAHPHLRIDVAARPGKHPRAVCLGVRVPREVHLLLCPQGGLVDAEGLLHELGHALHLAHFDPELPFEQRSLPRNRALSEAFACLLQGLLASGPFLTALGLTPDEAGELIRARRLRDLALWRRHAAKLLAEVRMWQNGGPDDGRLYGELLSRHTGFRYAPSGYLADMEPGLYPADYLRAWMAAAQLTGHLERGFGEGWMFDTRAGELLRGLWRQGERVPLERVLEGLGLVPFDAGPLERRLSAP